MQQQRQLAWLELFEKLFTVATLYYGTGVLNALLMGGLAIEVDLTNLNIKEVKSAPVPGTVFLAIQFLIFFITLGLMGIRWPRFAKILTRPRLIWFYLLLVMASSFWSMDVIGTFRKTILLFATTLFGFYFAGRFNPRQQLLLAASALGATMFSHLTFGLLFPAYAKHVMHFAGAFRGLMTHKNSLAQMAVLCAVITQLCLPFPYKRRGWLWAGLAASVIVVLLTTSKTGLAVMIGLSLLLPMLRSLRAKRIETQLATITGVLLIVTLAIAFISNFEVILNALGRDATLTGRTGLWSVLADKVSLRPWLGYGFRSFWEGGMEGEAVDVWYAERYIVYTAHNGFLDVLLEVGFVGFGLFLLTVLCNLKRGLHWLLYSNGSEGLYPIVLLVYWLLYNLTESTTPQIYSISWMLYVAMTTSMLIYRLPGQQPDPSPQFPLPETTPIGHNQPQPNVNLTPP
jgi:exopolysaccharide production protein ExoQ